MKTSRENVHPELAQVALEKADGFAFERFAQDFLSVLEGRSFVPMGGVKDGGADGIYGCGNNRNYYQITRQENHRDKIRKTLKRLNEFGRTVQSIYYLSSRIIPHIDKEEDLLTEELGVRIKIRDRKYIISHINDSNGTIAAYINHLSVFTQFLANVASSEHPSKSASINDPSVFVFLQHEVTNRLGNRKLVHSLTDTMILWALSETDPDRNIFMSEDEVGKKIFDRFPWTTKLLKGHIKQRLKLLRIKGVSNREIRWYPKDKKYCLPYVTRETIKSENQIDESLKITVLEEIKFLVSELFDSDDGEYQLIAELCNKVVHSVFERQGLLFSHFLAAEERTEAPLVVADCIDNILSQQNIPSRNIETYREYIEIM